MVTSKRNFSVSRRAGKGDTRPDSPIHWNVRLLKKPSKRPRMGPPNSWPFCKAFDRVIYPSKTTRFWNGDDGHFGFSRIEFSVSNVGWRDDSTSVWGRATVTDATKQANTDRSTLYLRLKSDAN